MDESVENAVFLAKRMLIDNIWRATGIEGLGTTFPKTEAILNGLPVESTYEEINFVVGMKRGWEYILSNIRKGNSLLFIMELHEVTCKNLVRRAGYLRDGEVRVSGSSYIPEVPNADEVFKDLITIDSVGDGIQKALALFCYLSRGQLFWDGNKRMAQLIANKVLIESGVGILSIGYKEQSLTKFRDLLIDYYNTNNASKLCSYLRTCIEYV